MKELMLCVILVAAGALAQTVEPEEGIGGERIAKPGYFPKWCYTRWFNRDSPSGYGDYETFAHLRDENPRKICPYPYFIVVQTLAGVNAHATGQTFQFFDTVNGFVCENSQQSGYRRCLDYKVRFACPCSWTGPYLREAEDEAVAGAGAGPEAVQ